MAEGSALRARARRELRVGAQPAADGRDQPLLGVAGDGDGGGAVDLLRERGRGQSDDARRHRLLLQPEHADRRPEPVLPAGGSNALPPFLEALNGFSSFREAGVS